MFFLVGSFLFFIHLIFFSCLLLFDRLSGVFLDFYLFDFCGLVFNLVFVFDWVSLGFASFVSLISSGVFFYSVYYMGNNSLNVRFIFLLFGFVLSMFLLVFGGNMFVVMVGWDGLGLISFCLVVYYQSFYSLDSGLVTFYSNRVRDVFFLFSFGYFFLLGDFQLSVFGGVGFVAFLFLFVGCIAKSAQLPFSAWLPAAMAAPTPVSSLVHSSTLVTAGVYVLIRFNAIFFSFSWLVGLSCLTMFLSGLVACLEKDMKKVIAMSTLSQLSVMVFSLSLGFWKLAYLHVILHALYKSLLFLGCGGLMVHLLGCQDSRFFGGGFGGVGKICFYTSSVSLVGFPFAVGFFSKDVIILIGSLVGVNFFSLFLFFLGCLFTVFYSLRLIYHGFILEPFFCSVVSKEEPFFYVFSVFVLWCWATLTGFVFSWFCVCDMFFFLRGFDFFAGILFSVLGTTLFLFGIFGIFAFFSIFYLRFIGELFSFNFSFYSGFYTGDSVWLEFLGPRGLYLLFFRAGYFFSFKGWTMFGSLVLFFCFFSIFF